MNLIIYGIVSFAITLLIIPLWIKRARAHNLVSKDMHKPEKTAVEFGGLCMICGFLFGALSFTAYDVFVNQSSTSLLSLFASLCAVLIALFIGFIDDILGWKIGLKQWHKILLPVLAALPIMAINAGDSLIHLPFSGQVNVGLLFPLVFIPIGIIGASNGFNMIAGFNGLEAGMGIIILSALSALSFFQGSIIGTVLALSMIGALLGFLWYNWYPASIFPGDSLTYPVGTLIAVIAILANIEAFALILFIPYFAEFGLKARGKMQKESFGKPADAGTLSNQYDAWYGLEHIMISFWNSTRFKATERKVVLSIYGMECFFILLAFLHYFY